ncbi:MAG: tRNA 5-methoxyuridine(34)/uridine 5-oxyacetic acid(34) synthase CmoB [Desulfobulbaceae bacterium]|nr:MAG: tRNA 5-methoxyuridine(34)/uridine 5-oxyacetic acid(34) synthase CmoB [Desulfobulbaceae bacterium]
MNYIKHFAPQKTRTEIIRLHQQKQRWVNQQKKGFLRFRTPYQAISAYQSSRVCCDHDLVRLGDPDEITLQQRQEITEHLRAFMPWRKGPFSIFGIDIDSEWQSGRKWQRIEPHLPVLNNKVIADIGCNNGYYMFRMTPYKPQFVLGLEPSVQHYYCFKALNSIAGFDNLEIDLLGVEHIHLFPEVFDVIFLMGVIYHRSSPVEVLRELLAALKPGGTIILESQAIPGDEPIALFPEKTYAKVPGTYFVPTGTCLQNWMIRAGFGDVELFCSHPMNSDEQRRTEWMIFESYEDFIDPGNPSLTIEGYPAPCRVFLKGTKT